MDLTMYLNEAVPKIICKFPLANLEQCAVIWTMYIYNTWDLSLYKQCTKYQIMTNNQWVTLFQPVNFIIIKLVKLNKQEFWTQIGSSCDYNKIYVNFTEPLVSQGY